MSKIDQLERNWKVFNELKCDLEPENAGRTALLHDGELIAIYNDSGDAYEIGREKYGLGNFSVETFGEKPRSLGFFTGFVHSQGSVAA